MSFVRVLVLFVLSAASVSCDAPAGPSERVYLDLWQFETPAAASAGDTVRIAFRYSRHCGPPPAVDVAIRSGSVEVAVWTDQATLDRPCLAIYPVILRSEFRVLPDYLGEARTLIRFRRATAPDSVREIVTQQRAVTAP
jgi:hypothetical protein